MSALFLPWRQDPKTFLWVAECECGVTLQGASWGDCGGAELLHLDDCLVWHLKKLRALKELPGNAQLLEEKLVEVLGLTGEVVVVHLAPPDYEDFQKMISERARTMMVPPPLIPGAPIRCMGAELRPSQVVAPGTFVTQDADGRRATIRFR